MLRVTKKILDLFDKKLYKSLIGIACLMLIGGIMESISVTLMLPLVTAITDAEGWNEAGYAKIIINFFGVDSQKQYICLLLVLLIILFIVKNIFLVFEYYVQNSFSSLNRYKLQIALLQKYINKPYSFFLNSETGKIIRIISGDSNQAFAALNNLLVCYTELSVCLIMVVTVFIVSPMMTSIIAGVLVIEVIAIELIIKPFMRRLGDTQRRANASANKWMLNSISGIKSIKVSNKEKFFTENYNRYAKVQAETERKNVTISAMPKLIIESITVSAVLISVLIMVNMGCDMNNIVPMLSAFLVAMIRLLPSVNKISVAMNQIAFFEGGVDNVLTTLKNDTDSALKEKAELIKKMRFDQRIKLENISFSYENSERPILEEANLEILKGQSIGLVGTSGSGKTTTMDLLLGLLSPNKGRITVDDIEISSNMSGWLSNVAYIPQTIFLTDDTIKENVAFGIKEEDISEEKVWEALQGAQMDEFVKSLPDGMNTRIGESGVRISGGQRQRIGIARALYNDPDVLFFDEATSALDTNTEAAIMESIYELKGKKTIIIIAHRLSTIENCDIVYRVENGKIEETTI